MALKTKQLQIKPEWIAAAQFENEPQWFTDLRQAAAQRVGELSLPTIDKVDYHTWPLFDFPDSQGGLAPASLETDLTEFQFVSVGNQTVKNELTTEAKSKGVILSDLATALKDHEDLVKQYFMTKAVKSDEDQLVAVAAALVNGGAFLYVPANVELTEPIKFLQVEDNRVPQLFVNHTVIVAGDNSNFDVLQRVLATGTAANNPAHLMVELITEPGSHVKFSSLDSLAEQTYAYLNRRGYLERDSHIDWAFGVLNDGNTVADFDSDLVGDGSHAEVKAVAISTGKQVQGIDTRVTNHGKHSEGNILQRGVLLEKSTLVFNGIGKIIHGAHGAKAQQENRILMLSSDARGDANPILLIDENDVIAGHAASVGRINQDQLYYLMSRGIPKEVAQRLVVRGFLGVVLREIPAQSVRDQMVDMIERKLVHGQRTEK